MVINQYIYRHFFEEILLKYILLVQKNTWNRLGVFGG